MLSRLVLALFTLAVFSFGQTTQATSSLRFEAATFKPSPPGGRGGGIRPLPGGQRYQATNLTIRTLMQVAYHLKAEQIVGGPSWLDTDRFDMNARAERPSTADELHAMLVNLLKEELKLAFHHEKKELPVYALTVDKAGPKQLTPHKSTNSGESWIEIEQDTTPGAFLKNIWHAKFCSMEYFAFRLGQILDRPVADQTNLKDEYDFDLAFTREPPPNFQPGAQLNGVEVDMSGPTVFDAIQKQLGMKLEKQRAEVQILVIDHAEKPSPSETP